MTTFTYYGSSVADGTLTTACDMASTTGGTETSKISNNTFSSGNVYMEVTSKGLTTAGQTTLPAPTGNGWIVTPGAMTLSAAAWSASVTLSHSVVANLSPILLRFYKLSSGVYTPLGNLSTPITSSAKTTYTFASSVLSQVTFGASDRLYIDLWIHDSTGTSGDVVTVYLSSSATNGVTGDMQITTGSTVLPTLVQPPDGHGLYEGINPTDYLTQALARLDVMAAAGFKLVMNYQLIEGHASDMVAYINHAASVGMKVIVGLHFKQIWKTNTISTTFPLMYADSGNQGTDSGFTTYIVNQVKGLAGTWGYYVGDEVAAADHTALKVHTDIVKAADATHPRLLVESSDETNSFNMGTTPFWDCCDVGGDDYYPLGDDRSYTKNEADTSPEQLSAGITAYCASKSISPAVVLQAQSWQQYYPPSRCTTYPACAPFPSQTIMKANKDAVCTYGSPRCILWYSFFDVYDSANTSLVTPAPSPQLAQWYALQAAITVSYVPSNLTYYGSSVLDGTLTTASKMAPTTGGTETSKTTIFTVTSHVYGEIWSQGNAGLATVDAIPSTPTGHGWIFYPGTGTFVAGNWSAAVTLSAANWGLGSTHTSATIRFFKYTPGTGYSLIGTITKAITGLTKTVYTFDATSMSSVAMGVSDGIYADLWWWDNNSYAATDNPTIYESSSATLGVTNDLVVITSIFTAVPAIRNASGRASIIAPRTTKNACGRVSIQSADIVTPTDLIQSRTGSVGSSNATYVTVTSAQTTQHNLLVAFVEIQGASGVIVTPPTDWQLVSGSTTDMGSYGTATIGLYYLPDCPYGVTSHTFSFDSSVNACVAFEEWSGMSITSPLDRYVIQHNAKTTAAPTGTTSALASGNELAVWGLAVHAAGVLTYSAVTNGYVEDTGAHAYSAEVSRAQGTLFYNKKVGPSATSSGATMSATGGSGNTTILAVFKQTASTASKGAIARVRVVSSTHKSATARVHFGGNLAGKNAVGRASVVTPPQSTRSAIARVRFNTNPTTVKNALGRLTLTVSRTTKNASGRARLAVAHTYYIATTGDDTTGNGSAGSPWATLEKARTLVVAGDTVRVLPGLYTPSYSTTRGVYTSVSGILSSPITWVSDVKYGARIVTTGKTDSWYNAGNYTIIDGFDISSTDATTGLNNASNYSSVRNCLIHDNPGYGIYHGVGFTYAETISNVVARCGEAATHHGIYHGVATGYIQNNIVAQAGGYNIYLWNAATTVTVANNLSIDAGAGGILIGAGDTGATVCDFCVVSNNVVLYNISGGGYGIREFGATGIHNQYLNNCVYGNTIDIALSNGLIALATLATDPLFMDYQADGSGDYHLKQPSPLRAAGTATGMPAYDIAGYVRTVPPDIGPYSYDASGFPPLAAMVGSAILPVLQDGFTFDQRIDDRAGGSFSVVDSTLSYVFDENQAITIADIKEDVTLYNGFIDKADEILLVPPNTLRRTFTLKDLRYLLEKRLCIEDFANWIAGAIVAHVHQSVLQEEGILASYALDRDHDAVAFGEGTLTNVSAANGYLELARAGSNVVDVDTTTADFSAGTLSGVVATDNTLTLASYTALKVSGTAGKNVGVNAGNYYTYWTIWSGSLTISSGDYLEYSMWISSMSADLVGGVDILCSDKTALKDTHWPDQYGIDSHPGAHMQGWADDQWLYRKIVMPPDMVGKTMNTVRVALESDKDGFYAFYARGIHFKSSGGTTRAAIFDTTLQRCTKVSNIGYYHIVIKPLTVYEERGTRIAPSLTLTSVGIAGGSDCSWTATETSQPASVFSETDTPFPQVLVESSIDGGDTWQTCTNSHVVPSLIVGENLSGKSLLLKQTLAVGGPNPEMAPVISDCAVGIESAYNMTKTDASRSYAGSEMTDGTNTNCGYQAAINTADGWQRNDVSGLKMNGWRKTWRTGESPNQPVFGSSVPGAGTSNGAYYIQSGAGTGAHVQLQNAGTHTPTIVMEADIQIGTANNAGILYFTTFWGNTDNSFGYYAYISTNVIGFGKGANANSNTWTSLWTLSATLDANQWYHIKAVCGSDHIHHIFIDDVEYITWTDASYTSGGVGMRMSSGGANGQAHFDNIGVATIGVNTDYTPATATRTAPSVSLSTVANVGDSRIWWVEDIPSGCTLDVQVSINGGSTYVSCVNGETLPVLSHGQSLSGVSLLLKVIQTSGSISYTPTLLGISWVVTGVFSASGNRISPLLSTIPAGVIGSSSVTWDADEPSSTTFEVDGSLDGSAWTLMNNGDAFVGLVQQGDVWWDSFGVDTSTDYTVS